MCEIRNWVEINRIYALKYCIEAIFFLVYCVYPLNRNKIERGEIGADKLYVAECICIYIRSEMLLSSIGEFELGRVMAFFCIPRLNRNLEEVHNQRAIHQCCVN